MKATANSKTVTANIIAKGIKDIIDIIPPTINIFHINPANITNNICPAVILAANLTPNDRALTVFDINSSVTINGANNKGLPFGIKALKKLYL